MDPRISAALIATLLAAFGLLTPESKPNPIGAARLNNIGPDYMDQQLFEKGLKAFQQAAEADPKLAIARLNEGIAYLNLQKVDEAKAALEDALRQDSKNSNASSRLIRTTPTPGIFWARRTCRPSSFRRPLTLSSTR